MKKSYFFLAVLCSTFSLAQVGINTTTPNSTFEVAASPLADNKVDGLLIPKISGDDLRSKNNLYNTAQHGTLLYVTIADSVPSGKTVDVLSPGFYFYDSTLQKWTKLNSAVSSAVEPWYIQNTTNPATSNTDSIYQTGSVAIGKNAAYTDGTNTSNLDVAGAVRFGNDHQGTIGDNSVAFGTENEASGVSSFAQGYQNKVSGYFAASAGEGNNVSGESAFGLGSQNTVSGTWSGAFGRNNNVSSPTSNAFGYENIIASSNSFAFGTSNTISGYLYTSLAVGTGNNISGSHSVSFGGTAPQNVFLPLTGNTVTGNNSFVAGSNNTVSGLLSTTFGYNNNTKGFLDFTVGQNNDVDGEASAAIGRNNKIAGPYAGFAFGQENEVYGNFSIVLGNMNKSGSAYETIMGHNAAITTGNTSQWLLEDPLFQLGNVLPFDAYTRNNALTILKNAHTAIGVVGVEAAAKPTELLDLGGEATAGNGGLRIRNLSSAAYTGDIATDKIVVADADGVLKSIDPASLSGAASPWFVQSTSNSSVNNTDNIYQTGSVAIGKNAVYTDGTTSVKLDVAGAVRFGNNLNGDVGINSAVLGSGSASGENAVTIGSGNSEGSHAIALAGGNALEQYTLAWGMQSMAMSQFSMALGVANTATGSNSTAIGGYSNSAAGDFSFAAGNGNQSSGENSVTLGRNNTSSGKGSTISGGGSNEASEEYTVISGGVNNDASASAATVSGGADNIASGAYSVVSGGIGNTAASYGEWSGGVFSTNYTPSSSTVFQGADRIYNVGNGSSASARKDAFTILKNGKTGIGFNNFEATVSDALLQVNGNVRIAILPANNATATDKIVMTSTDGTLKSGDMGTILGAISVNLKVYANDAAADADSTLPSGALYKVTGSRAVYQKP